VEAAELPAQVITFEDASAALSTFSIPNFDAPDAKDFSILSSISSSSWQQKKAAIEALSAHVANNADPSHAPHFIAFVKNFTRNFKDSNFNVMKAVHSLLSAILSHHSPSTPAAHEVLKIATTLAVEKLADKKLAEVRERSYVVERRMLATKTAHARTSVQDAPLPFPAL